MRSVDYDLRKFQCILFHTDLFQREGESRGSSFRNAFSIYWSIHEENGYRQIWDSICTLILPNVDLLTNQKETPQTD